MSDLFLVCEPEYATGFQISGFDTTIITDSTMLLNLYNESKLKGIYKLIVYPDKFNNTLTRRERKKLSESQHPLMVSIPLEWKNTTDFEIQFSKMIKNILGFNIPISQIIKDNN